MNSDIHRRRREMRCIPLAASMPTFLALATPKFEGFRINSIRTSLGSGRTEQQDIVDPSLTTMSSKSRNVCRHTLEMARQQLRSVIRRQDNRKDWATSWRPRTAERMRSDGELNRCRVMAALEPRIRYEN